MPNIQVRVDCYGDLIEVAEAFGFEDNVTGWSPELADWLEEQAIAHCELMGIDLGYFEEE